jgi:hypothetical protein
LAEAQTAKADFGLIGISVCLRSISSHGEIRASSDGHYDYLLFAILAAVAAAIAAFRTLHFPQLMTSFASPR